jgi:hypothetical protein
MGRRSNGDSQPKALALPVLEPGQVRCVQVSIHVGGSIIIDGSVARREFYDRGNCLCRICEYRIDCWMNKVTSL